MDDIRAVMDAAGSRRAAMFGWIDGAPLSLVFAATFPERVSALVLLGSFARRMWVPHYPWGMTEEQFRAANEVFMKVFFGSRSEGIEALRLITGTAPDEDELGRDVDFVRRACGSPDTWRAYLELYHDFDVRSGGGFLVIRVPTLLIHGSEAGAIMPAQGARQMAAQIAGSRWSSSSERRRSVWSRAHENARRRRRPSYWACGNSGSWGGTRSRPSTGDSSLHRYRRFEQASR